MARRVWVILALLTAPAIPARAQNPPGPAALDADSAYNLAANWIVDADPRRQAWAAELIASRQFEALYPRLLTALAVFQPRSSGQFDGTPDEMAPEVIADAIIRAGLPVPPGDADKLYPEFPALAMILLSRPLADNRSALASILREAKVAEVWLAAADLLARDPTREFVTQQLDDFSVFVRFLVLEPGQGGGVSGDCFDVSSLQASAHPLRTPEDWPPFSVYQLTTKEGDAVIANGLNSVSFTRQAIADPRPWTGSGCGGPEIQELRRDLILQLSGINPSQTGLRAVVLSDITRETDDQYRRDATATLREQARSFANVVRQLQSSGLITPDQAAERRLHMQVFIVGTHSARPLPDLPDLSLLGIVGQYQKDSF